MCLFEVDGIFQPYAHAQVPIFALQLASTCADLGRYHRSLNGGDARLPGRSLSATAAGAVSESI